MESIANCIREKGNWSKLESEHRFDHPKFSPKRFAEDIDAAAPKLKRLIDNIRELDDQDMKNHGKKYKHFIYSDIKSAYGAKLIASALASHGFEHAYHLAKSSRGMTFEIKKKLDRLKGDVFATLTSTLLFEKPIGIRFRKELLGLFNKRPDNVNGEHIRIIILDSGFREGIDLFDIKYVHLFEPIMTAADQKQAIGRATRFCGQKGLQFQKNIGWPIYVYKYETVIPVDVRNSLLSQNIQLAPAKTFFDLFMKFTNLDPRKITFANELEPLVIFGAIDRYLTRHVHNFTIEGLTQNEHFGKIFHGAGKLSEFQKMQKYIREKYSKYTWPTSKIENGCEGSPSQQQGTTSLVNFSPSQEFVRYFFTSANPQKGILLNWSVGCGKTCGAIAIGSSSFEKEDYTIIYVTRHTLKGDVWKNMFGQTCSVLIQDMIKKGLSIPEAEAKRQRLIKAWMEPMSYKQFSNMISGKSSLYTDLVKRNGKKDVLKKTLVIIDEAHKLNAPDVTGAEKPDLDAIKNAFMHSYKTSGKDSAKLVLMTGTPYTDDPMDMMKLLNLLRPEDYQLPEAFDDFQKNYLDEHGKFTKDGKLKFLDDIAGYVSYLNREKDVRSFSYPIFTDVQVPLSEYEFNKELEKYIRRMSELKELKKKLNVAKTELEREKIDIEMKLRNQLALKDVKKLQEEYNECVEESNQTAHNALKELERVKMEALIQCQKTKAECQKTRKAEYEKAHKALKAEHKVEVAKCKDVVASCKEAIKSEADDKIKRIKVEAKKALVECKKGDKACKEAIKEKEAKDISEVKLRMKKDVEKCSVLTDNCKDRIKAELQQNIDVLKEDLKFDLKECTSEEKVKTCIDQANEQFIRETANIKPDLTKCITVKEKMQKYEKLEQEQIKNRVELHIQKAKARIENIEKVDLPLMQKDEDTLKKSILASAPKDRSQQKYLETCLKTQKIKPHYEQVLKGKLPDYIDDEDEKVPDEIPEEAKANIYVINGHGSEDVRAFEKRQTLPADKVLIVFPLCARPTWTSVTCPLLDVFNKPEYMKLLANPIKYKKEIEEITKAPIRIYLPGDKVPFMSTNLFDNFDKDIIVLAKSGVFELGKIPIINRDVIPDATSSKYHLGHKTCVQFSGVIENKSKYSGAVHREIYKGNRYAKAAIKEPYEKMERRSFQIKDILEETGPGIYYYTGCRSSYQKFSDTFYANILAESAAQQQKPERDQKRKMKEFINHLNVPDLDPSDFNDEQIQPNTDSTVPETPPKKKQVIIKDKQLYQSIDKEVKELLQTFEDIKVSEADKLIQKCHEWKKALKDAENPPIEAIDDLLMMVEGSVVPTTVLDFKKSKTFYTVTLSREYKCTTRKYTYKDKDVGVIPLGQKSKADKCSTETLITRIKQLHNKDRLDQLELPVSIDEYENLDVFVDVCNKTKKLVLARVRNPSL